MDTKDKQACCELAMSRGTEFELIYRFMPPSEGNRRLALEALFVSLRDVPLAVSDPAVGVAKLGWWQQELANARQSGSQHPVVKALVSTGVLERLDQTLFVDYLHQLIIALDSESISDCSALHQQLSTLGLLEVRLSGSANDEDSIESLGNVVAAARLLALSRTLSRQQGQHDWLPMDIIAKIGLIRGSKLSDQNRVDAVVALAQTGLEWLSDVTHVDRTESVNGCYERLLHVLTERRLKRAMKNPAKLLSGEYTRSMSDVFAVWRASRKAYKSYYTHEAYDD